MTTWSRCWLHRRPSHPDSKRTHAFALSAPATAEPAPVSHTNQPVPPSPQTQARTTTGMPANISRHLLHHAECPTAGNTSPSTRGKTPATVQGEPLRGGTEPSVQAGESLSQAPR